MSEPHMFGGYLLGVTVTPYKHADGTNINRETTYDDWSHANQVDRENEEKARTLQQAQLFNNNIRLAIGEFGLKYVMPVMMTLGGGPATLIPGLLGWGGAEATNYATNAATDGKYETWGLMLSDKTGTTNKWGQMAWEFTNPGAILGGLLGTGATTQAGTNTGLAFRNLKQSPKEIINNGEAFGGRAALTPEHEAVLKQILNRWGGDLNITDERLWQLGKALSEPERYLTAEERLALAKLKFNHDVFADNFKGYVLGEDGDVQSIRANGNLANKNFYHEALTNDLILLEFGRMGLPEPVLAINEDLIGNFFSKDALPRLLENLKELGVDVTPELLELITKMYTKPWEGVDMRYGYTMPGSGGYSQGASKIRYAFGSDVPESTVAHELHHSVRHRLSKMFENSPTRLSLESDLEPGQISGKYNRAYWLRHRPEYTTLELNNMKPFKFSSEDIKSLTPTSELGATLMEARFNAYRELTSKLGRYPSVAEVNNYLDDLANLQGLLFRLENAGYGGTFGRFFRLAIDDAATNTGDSWVADFRAGIKPKGMTDLLWEDVLRRMPSVVERIAAKWRRMSPDTSEAEWYVRLAGRLYGEDTEFANVNNLIKSGMKKVAGYGIPVTVGTYLMGDEK